jgi:hypothetical protein
MAGWPQPKGLDTKASRLFLSARGHQIANQNPNKFHIRGLLGVQRCALQADLYAEKSFIQSK